MKSEDAYVDVILHLPVRGIVRGLALVIAGLALLSISGHLMVTFLPVGEFTRGLIWFVDLNKEGNLPTWYSSSGLLLAALLLAVISREEKRRGSRYSYHWLFLSLVFLFLSLDEVAGLHERSSDPVRSVLKTQGGAFYYSWVIPGMIFVFAVGVLSLKFLFSLNPRIRKYFLIAGFLFVAGSLGMEMVGGSWAARHGRFNLTYYLMTDFEETLEMSGVLVFIGGLLLHLQSSAAAARKQMAARLRQPRPDFLSEEQEQRSRSA
jgi:hypothetical protein